MGWAVQGTQVAGRHIDAGSSNSGCRPAAHTLLVLGVSGQRVHFADTCSLAAGTQTNGRQAGKVPRAFGGAGRVPCLPLELRCLVDKTKSGHGSACISLLAGGKGSLAM